MVSFFSLLIPTVVLGVVEVLVRALRTQLGVNETTHFMLFAIVYAIAVGLVILWLPFHFFITDLVFVALGAVGYFRFSQWFERRHGVQSVSGSHSLSTSADSALPNQYNALPNVLQVLLQTLAFLGVVLMVHRLIDSLPIATILCMCLVAGMYFPSRSLFGKLYGRGFFITATVMAGLFIPFLIMGTLWLGQLYVMHLVLYGLLYSGVLTNATKTPAVAEVATAGVKEMG